MRPPLAVLVVVGLFAASGCGKKTNGDCQKLVQLVGPQHASLTAAFGRSDQAPAELEAQALGWDKAAAELNAATFETEDVKNLATRFATSLTTGAKIRRDMAAAGLEPAAAAAAQAAAATVIVEETKAKAAIDMTCR